MRWGGSLVTLGRIERGLLLERIEPGLGEERAGHDASAVVGVGVWDDEFHVGCATGVEGGEGDLGIGDDDILVTTAVVEAEGGLRGPAVEVIVAESLAERVIGPGAESGEDVGMEDAGDVLGEDGVDFFAGMLSIEEWRQGGLVFRGQEVGQGRREPIDALVRGEDEGEVVGIGHGPAGEDVGGGDAGEVVGSGHGGGGCDCEFGGVVLFEVAVEGEGGVAALGVTDEEELSIEAEAAGGARCAGGPEHIDGGGCLGVGVVVGVDQRGSSEAEVIGQGGDITAGGEGDAEESFNRAVIGRGFGPFCEGTVLVAAERQGLGGGDGEGDGAGGFGTSAPGVEGFVSEPVDGDVILGGERDAQEAEHEVDLGLGVRLDGVGAEETAPVGGGGGEDAVEAGVVGGCGLIGPGASRDRPGERGAWGDPERILEGLADLDGVDLAGAGIGPMERWAFGA